MTGSLRHAMDHLLLHSLPFLLLLRLDNPLCPPLTTMDKVMNKISSSFKKGADENTPLAASAGASSSIASNAQQANDYAIEKAKELRIMAREGDFSIRLLALIGGVGMCAVSAFGFISTLLHFHGISALLEVYTFCLGVIVILLESSNMPFISENFRQNLANYANFLTFVWGRGILYFVAGTLELTQTGIPDMIVGCYMCLLGIAYIIIGRKTAKKLRTMRSELFSPLQLRSKFNEADKDGTGTLTMGQFKALTDSMGLDMNRRETEAAFMCMDKNDNSQLTFDEFENWWKTGGDDDASRALDSV